MAKDNGDQNDENVDETGESDGTPVDDAEQNVDESSEPEGASGGEESSPDSGAGDDSPIVDASADSPDGEDPPDEGGMVGSLSRRDAIKGALGGTLVAANAYLFTNIAQQAGDGDGGGIRDRVSNQLQLNVNGRNRFVQVEDQERLAETLRYKMGLTGTKFGCDRAMCGACTVLVDGDPIYACSYFTRDAVGKEIETIEGLEQGGQLHPLQESFIEELGGQCAFCTPGMIMSGKALLDENSDPDREEVKEALSGNLCRCGNYENEIAGVLNAAERM